MIASQRLLVLLGQAETRPAAPLSDGFPTGLVLTLILIVVAIGVLVTFSSRYKRCPSNKILVIHGQTGTGAPKCVRGGGVFVWPLLQEYSYLDLKPLPVAIHVADAATRGKGVRVTAEAAATVAVSTQPDGMQAAAARLLGLAPEEIQAQARDILAGQMRAALAGTTAEEIDRDRETFQGKLGQAASVGLGRLGLELIDVSVGEIEAKAHGKEKSQ